MMNVISSEIYKIVKNKVFYAVLSILLIMNIVRIFLGIKQKFVEDSILENGISAYASSFSGDGILYIILLFVVFLITSEYTTFSIRQMCCRGIERWKLVLGQYIAMTLIIIGLFIIFGFLNLFTFSLLFELGEINLGAFFKMNCGLLSMILAITAIGTFLSYLIKNVGITILASIFVITGSNVLASILTAVTNNNLFAIFSMSNVRKVVTNYSSSMQEVISYSIILLAITISLIVASSILFTKRDVD